MAIKGVDIAWEDFSIIRSLSRSEKKVRSKKGLSLDPVTVINKISGSIERGTFTAMLGPSGSGKTTFLNFLSNRLHFLKGLKYSGQVYINGHKREKLDYNSIAGYVMQEDVILEQLKVRETLEFSASFKMDKEQVKVRVDEVISKLGLKSCENSQIGGFMKKGISGGEKRRVSIGIELLTDPSILFLDEPTTGLDSFNSEVLIELLSKLSKTGVTVIATIHQPNSYIFALFDKMILFGGGEIIYHGGAEDSIDYFKNIGFNCPAFSNPAEYLLELITPGGDENYEENMEKIKAAIVKPEFRVVEKEIPNLFHRVEAGFFKELRLLVKRSALNSLRNVVAVLAKTIANVSFLLIVMAAYFGSCDGNSLESINNRAGVIFVVIMYMSFIGANSCASLSTDKAMFIREQASKTYSPIPFYLSKLIFDIPFDQLIVVVMAFLHYLSIGLSLDHPHQIFFFLFVVLILDFTARGWGNLLLISLPFIELSSMATPFLFMVQLLFAGLFINYDSIPNYLIWLEYMSMFKYSWSAIMISEIEYHDNDYWEGCDIPEDLQPSICDPLDFFSITISKWHNVLILACMSILIHLCSIGYLYILAKKYRVN